MDGSLAFATRTVDAPHRIETPTRLLFRGVPVRAVRNVPADPKVDLDVLDSSHGVHRSLPPPIRPSLRPLPAGPSPRLRFGTATSRTRSVPAVPPGSNGFLRRERIRRSAPSTACGFVAPRNRPWGSPRFRLPGIGLSAEPRPEGRGPEGPAGIFPVAHTLRSVPLPDSLRPCRHRTSSFRTRSRSPAGVPSRRSSQARSRVATVRCSARRPQGLLPSRSPLQARDVAAARPLDAPLGFGSTRSDAAARFAPPRHSGRFALRAIRFGVPGPERPGKARCFGLVWLRAIDGRSLPKERPRVIAVAPILPEGSPRPHPNRAPKDSVGCRWIRPKEIHRVGPSPEGAGCRRDRDASPKRLVRDPVLTPESGAGGSSSCSASFGARART
jgi:hypothetical protein